MSAWNMRRCNSATIVAFRGWFFTSRGAARGARWTSSSSSSSTMSSFGRWPLPVMSRIVFWAFSADYGLASATWNHFWIRRIWIFDRFRFHIIVMMVLNIVFFSFNKFILQNIIWMKNTFFLCLGEFGGVVWVWQLTIKTSRCKIHELIDFN